MKGHRDVNATPGGRGERCVFGAHPVREYLRRQPQEIEALWLARGGERRADLARLAAAAGIAVSYAEPEALARLAGARQHQGAVALLRQFAYADLEDLGAAGASLLVAADGMEDPRNLGALIRGIAAAGAGGVIIPQDRAAAVTAVVEKAAAGVTAWFPVCRVTNLVRALETLRQEHSYWIVGLAQDAEADLFGADLPRPAVLVVGGESGLRPLVRRSCDLVVSIPMAERVESLNAAVAGALAAYEIRRRG